MGAVLQLCAHHLPFMMVILFVGAQATSPTTLRFRRAQEHQLVSEPLVSSSPSSHRILLKLC